MDSNHVAALYRALAIAANSIRSRRGLLAGLTSGLLGSLALSFGSEDAAAKNKKNKKKAKRKKSRRHCLRHRRHNHRRPSTPLGALTSVNLVGATVPFAAPVSAKEPHRRQGNPTRASASPTTPVSALRTRTSARWVRWSPVNLANPIAPACSPPATLASAVRSFMPRSHAGSAAQTRTARRSSGRGQRAWSWVAPARRFVAPPAAPPACAPVSSQLHMGLTFDGLEEETFVNINRFDEFTRTLSDAASRREVWRGFAGAGAALLGIRLQTAAAKRKHHKKRKEPQPQGPPSPPSPTCTPRCGHKRCGDDDCGGSCGTCPSGQFCRSGTCFTPKPTEVTCTVNCDGTNCPKRCDAVTTIGTCGQPVACSCPSGHECLSNGSCGQVCQGAGDCPGQDSNCSNCNASTEGAKHCTVRYPACSEPVCTATADCPVGTHCQVTNCGPNGNEKRCIKLSFCPG